jgi:hypothetical protein
MKRRPYEAGHGLHGGYVVCGLFIAVLWNKVLGESVAISENTLHLYFFRKKVYNVVVITLTTTVDLPALT